MKMMSIAAGGMLVLSQSTRSAAQNRLASTLYTDTLGLKAAVTLLSSPRSVVPSRTGITTVAGRSSMARWMSLWRESHELTNMAPARRRTCVRLESLLPLATTMCEAAIRRQGRDFRLMYEAPEGPQSTSHGLLNLKSHHRLCTCWCYYLPLLNHYVFGTSLAWTETSLGSISQLLLQVRTGPSAVDQIWGDGRRV